MGESVQKGIAGVYGAHVPCARTRYWLPKSIVDSAPTFALQTCEPDPIVTKPDGTLLLPCEYLEVVAARQRG